MQHVAAPGIWRSTHRLDRVRRPSPVSLEGNDKASAPLDISDFSAPRVRRPGLDRFEHEEIGAACRELECWLRATSGPAIAVRGFYSWMPKASAHAGDLLVSSSPPDRPRLGCRIAAARPHERGRNSCLGPAARRGDGNGCGRAATSAMAAIWSGGTGSLRTTVDRRPRWPRAHAKAPLGGELAVGGPNRSRRAGAHSLGATRADPCRAEKISMSFQQRLVPALNPEVPAGSELDRGEAPVAPAFKRRPRRRGRNRCRHLPGVVANRVRAPCGGG